MLFFTPGRNLPPERIKDDGYLACVILTPESDTNSE